MKVKITLYPSLHEPSFEAIALGLFRVGEDWELRFIEEGETAEQSLPLSSIREISLCHH